MSRVRAQGAGGESRRGTRGRALIWALANAGPAQCSFKWRVSCWGGAIASRCANSPVDGWSEETWVPNGVGRSSGCRPSRMGASPDSSHSQRPRAAWRPRSAAASGQPVASQWPVSSQSAATRAWLVSSDDHSGPTAAN